MVFRLVYLSRATIPFDDAALKELARLASEHNSQHEITGFLTFRRGAFIQYLEGAACDVQALMESIEADTRHTMVRRLDLGDREQRAFPDWHMQFVSSESLEIDLEEVLTYVLKTWMHPVFADATARATAERLCERIACRQMRSRGTSAGGN